MSSIKSNIQSMIDSARSKGLRVEIRHERFGRTMPVRIYSDGRIKHVTFVDRNRERDLKGQHAYAREARGITIARVLDGRKIVARGFSICGKQDNFSKTHGTVRALASALKGI